MGLQPDQIQAIGALIGATGAAVAAIIGAVFIGLKRIKYRSNFEPSPAPRRDVIDDVAHDVRNILRDHEDFRDLHKALHESLKTMAEAIDEVLTYAKRAAPRRRSNRH